MEEEPRLAIKSYSTKKDNKILEPTMIINPVFSLNIDKISSQLAPLVLVNCEGVKQIKGTTHLPKFGDLERNLFR